MTKELKKELNGSKEILSYKIEENEIVDDISIGMITSNDIPNLLRAFIVQTDDEKSLKYDVSGLVSLDEFLKSPITKDQLIAIIRGIVNAFVQIDEYMIPTNSLLINDNKYIFFNQQKNICSLICLPINIDNTTNKAIDLKEIVKLILMSVSLRSNVEIIGKIINYLNSNGKLSALEFNTFVNMLNSNSNTVVASKKENNSISKTLDRDFKNAVGLNNNENSVLANSQSQVKAQPAINEKKTNSKKAKHHNSGVGKIENIPNITNVPNVSNKKSNINIPDRKGNINIPNANITDMQNANDNNSNEPKISLFYLLQHYNAENAAIYKKQKDEKKNKSQVSINPANMQNVNMASNVQNNINTINKSFTDKVDVSNDSGRKLNFGNTTVIGGETSKKTTVLSDKGFNDVRQVANIIRKKTNEKISINSFPFNIGGALNWASYVIFDNTAVSQKHATINFLDNRFFIVDNGSTNSTYVNGEKLVANTSKNINSGDRIRLADEDFIFEIV